MLEILRISRPGIPDRSPRRASQLCPARNLAKHDSCALSVYLFFPLFPRFKHIYIYMFVYRGNRMEKFPNAMERRSRNKGGRE